jgi:hypothetical protein
VIRTGEAGRERIEEQRSDDQEPACGEQPSHPVHAGFADSRAGHLQPWERWRKLTSPFATWAATARQRPDRGQHQPQTKVAFGLLTQLGLEGQPQTEINEILHYQKAVGLPITLAQVGVEVTAEALVAALKVADQLGRKLG